MTFDEYQEAAMRTAGPAARFTDAICLSALGICGEGGELADLVKKMLYHGHTVSAAVLLEEIGDVLWYTSRMCSALGFSLESVAINNINKLERRYPGGFSSERSINREP